METFLQFFTDEEAELPCQADNVPAPRTEWPAALSELQVQVQVQVQVQTGAAAANEDAVTVRARTPPPAAPRRRHTLQRVRASMIGMKTKKAKKTKAKKAKKAEKAEKAKDTSVTDHMHPDPWCEVVMNYDWFSLDASQGYADRGECTLMLGPPAV